MAKIPCSTSLEKELYDRIARVARADRRSVAQIVARCVEEAFPEIEAEVSKFKEGSVPYRVSDSGSIKRVKKVA